MPAGSPAGGEGRRDLGGVWRAPRTAATPAMGFSSQAGFCCARSCRGKAGRSTQASRRTAHLAVTTPRSPTLVLDNIDLDLTGFVGTPPRFAAGSDGGVGGARSL